MTEDINLQADHTAAVREIPFQGFIEANQGYAPSYGADKYSQELHAVLESMLGRNVHIAFAVGGTEANVLALDALKYAINEPAATIFTPSMSHIVVHEAGIIPRMTGMSIVRFSSYDGKFQPERLDSMLAKREDDTVFEQPAIVSITNPTEVGIVWQPEEIKRLADYCHSRGLFLFIDGARLWNAAATLNFNTATEALRILCEHADAFTVGMIKNGAGLADIACLNADLLSEKKWGRLVKQHGAELAKARYYSAPALADLKSETEPIEAAQRANQLAHRIAEALTGLGVQLAWETETNMIWPLVTEVQHEALKPRVRHYREDDWTDLNLDEGWIGLTLLRFVTSWATSDEEVDKAIKLFRAVFSQEPVEDSL